MGVAASLLAIFSISQSLKHSTVRLTLNEGWMTERVNMNDGLGEIGEYLPYSCWAETAHLLSIAELPSVYVDLENGKAFAIDHVEVELIRRKNKWLLMIENPTYFDATVTYQAESAEDKQKTWNDFFWLDSEKITIPAGESVKVTLR